jgi:hypothetical protein
MILTRLRLQALASITAALLGYSSAAAGERLARPAISIDSIRIEVIWVESQAQLDAKRLEYGTPRPASGVIRATLEAFSVLGKRDGEPLCLIFAPKPARFDDRINTSLGHELLHCFGFSHGD